MAMVAFYFRMHQPMRLHPERDKFLWAEKDREIFTDLAETCYIPAVKLLTKIISKHPHFKIVMGMSGTFLEQADIYRSEVIRRLQQLLDAGEGQRVEFLDETYHHSHVSLYSDPKKREFRDQVSLHRDIMKRFFGIRPTSFANTDLIFNNEIAAVVSDMGYRAILCEKQDDMYLPDGALISSDRILKVKGSNLIAIPRNATLSNEVVAQFPLGGLTPAQYASHIAASGDDAMNLLRYDLDHIGGSIKKDKGIFEFWKELPKALARYPEVEILTITDLIKRFEKTECPTIEIRESSRGDWNGSDWDTTQQGVLSWVDEPIQHELFKDIERIEIDARKAGGDLLKKWRYLTASDHLCFLKEPVDRSAGALPETNRTAACPNPYGESIAVPAHIITRKIDNLEVTIKRFQVLKRREKTAVLIISPETGKLPDEMGALAQYISGKSGGQGEVVSALCNGLVERGIEVHLATLNLKKRFQKESGMDEIEWRQIRYRVDPERIHLVSSSLFAENMSAYSGNPVLTAAEFQRETVNNIITTVRAKSEGRLILHTHDWMAGGAITAYAQSRGLPVLHTVHNIFTENIPFDMMSGVDLNSMAYDLYLTEAEGKKYLDSQATAIKSATLINFVGDQFLKEVVEDYFMDRQIVPRSVRNEVKQKYRHNTALAIINAPAPHMYPERCETLVRRYGPDDDVLQAKKENRVAFQKKLGLTVNPEAIVLYWPSRLDPVQKGVDLLEEIALKFVIEHDDVQIAIVANGVGDSSKHTDTMGKIACASGGKIAYCPYEEDLSMLGYAAASDVFGASLYEPCGQIDQVGNLFGATATNRDTGGYHDKIRELRLKITGSPQDVGNGFLFRDYDTGGLWYAMHNSVLFHRLPESVRAEQIVRIMREARESYDLGGMIAEYIRTYERLNGGKPLG